MRSTLGSMPLMITRPICVLAWLLFGAPLACAPKPSVVALYPRPLHPPVGATCYRSEGALYPPLSPAHSGTTPARTWLVLAVRDSGRSAKAYSVWEDGRGQSGSWSPAPGDSIDVFLMDSFTSSTLRLAADTATLRGRGQGSTDERYQDSAGVWRVAEHTWTASARPAPCMEVPKTDDPR